MGVDGSYCGCLLAIGVVLGSVIKVSENRDHFLDSPWAPYVMATVHPSSILRAPDHDARERQIENVDRRSGQSKICDRVSSARDTVRGFPLLITIFVANFEERNLCCFFPSRN